LAGVAIGIGGTVYLSLDNKIVGAVLFSVGLYLICAHGLHLFTGKIGYAVNEKPAYLLEVLTVWAGNFIGTAIVALALSCTRAGESLFLAASSACSGRLADSYGSLLLLAIFCGVLMYGAVEGYKQTKNPLILFFCVSVFILSGFEHSIADMFYFSMARVWSLDTVFRLLVITLGNSLGGILIPLVKKLPEEKRLK
ncbi:MAG: formate/nitrite transporter family protein, partial [Christensenellaceae bacterium]